MDNDTVFLIVALILLIGTPLLIAVVQRISWFREELRYINMEIGRTRGGERAHWKRERRRLWKSLFLLDR